MSHHLYPGDFDLPLVFPGRRFQIWSYSVSHSELVLRACYDPTALHVELMFKPVRAVKLPSVMEAGLTVSEAGHTEVTAVLHDIGVVPHTGPVSRAFLLDGDHFAGYVVADQLFWAEETREKYSPFSLFHSYLSSDFDR